MARHIVAAATALVLMACLLPTVFGNLGSRRVVANLAGQGVGRQHRGQGHDQTDHGGERELEAMVAGRRVHTEQGTDRVGGVNTATPGRFRPGAAPPGARCRRGSAPGQSGYSA